jgi:hypothetical protein
LDAATFALVYALVALLGSLAPIALCLGLCRLGGVGVIATVGLFAASAAINSLWPAGGGMGVDDTWRVRFFKKEWTFDSQRSARERLLGPLTIGAATVGGFVLALPVMLAILVALAPLSALAEERFAIAALLSMLGVAMARHRPEVPLERWRNEIESGSVDASLWAGRVRRLARLVTREGAVGNVGGIGACTVGLHEHLDALAILERAAKANVEGAGELLERALAHLESRREAGGFPIYPGALPRKAFTERAKNALKE